MAVGCGAKPQPLAVADPSINWIRLNDEGVVDGRIKIALIESRNESSASEATRAVERLADALRGSGLSNVEIVLSRVRSFRAIPTDAPLLAANFDPDDRDADDLLREIERYANGGGLLMGAPTAMQRMGVWREVRGAHPLLTTPFQIEDSPGRNPHLFMVGRDAYAVSAGVAPYESPGDEMTERAAKQWLNVFAFAASRMAAASAEAP